MEFFEPLTKLSPETWVNMGYLLLTLMLTGGGVTVTLQIIKWLGNNKFGKRFLRALTFILSGLTGFATFLLGIVPFLHGTELVIYVPALVAAAEGLYRVGKSKLVQNALTLFDDAKRGREIKQAENVVSPPPDHTPFTNL